MENLLKEKLALMQRMGDQFDCLWQGLLTRDEFKDICLAIAEEYAEKHFTHCYEQLLQALGIDKSGLSIEELQELFDRPEREADEES